MLVQKFNIFFIIIILKPGRRLPTAVSENVSTFWIKQERLIESTAQKTWPKQARMAYEGKWQELRQWQDKLNGGR